MVTVEEHSVIGGLGSAVCDVLSEKAPTQVLKIGINDTYGESGPALELMQNTDWIQKVSIRRSKRLYKIQKREIPCRQKQIVLRQGIFTLALDCSQSGMSIS